MEAARRWLAHQGVSQVRDGWVSDEKPDVLLTANHVAHSLAGDVFAEDLDAADQVRLAFGLLDLLNEYWVTCEIRFANESAEGSHRGSGVVLEPVHPQRVDDGLGVPVRLQPQTVAVPQHVGR